MTNTKKTQEGTTPDKGETANNTGEKETETIPPNPEEVENQGSAELMETKLEAFEKKAKESYDRFLRISAEFENYKKRAAREMGEFRKFANESLVRELLPIVDNLERAIESSAGNDSIDDDVVEGVDMTLKEILKVFEKFSVTPIDALGETFDPTFHQAVMQEKVDTKPENTILKELQRGYMIHDRLLRPSMVVVSKSTEKKQTESL